VVELVEGRAATNNHISSIQDHCPLPTYHTIITIILTIYSTSNNDEGKTTNSNTRGCADHGSPMTMVPPPFYTIPTVGCSINVPLNVMMTSSNATTYFTPMMGAATVLAMVVRVCRCQHPFMLVLVLVLVLVKL